MVEQEAVNFEVASSSLASRAKHKHLAKARCFCMVTPPTPHNEHALTVL
jgi:hypothetical protein